MGINYTCSLLDIFVLLLDYDSESDQRMVSPRRITVLVLVTAWILIVIVTSPIAIPVVIIACVILTSIIAPCSIVLVVICQPCPVVKGVVGSISLDVRARVGVEAKGR